jgi:hypothetical protein
MNHQKLVNSGKKERKNREKLRGVDICACCLFLRRLVTYTSGKHEELHLVGSQSMLWVKTVLLL